MNDALDVRAVAALLGCHTDTVRRYAAKEGLPVVRLSARRHRYSKADVLAWLASRRSA